MATEATTTKIKDLVMLKPTFRFRSEKEERIEDLMKVVQRADSKWPFPPILVATAFPPEVTMDFDPKNKKEHRDKLLVGGYHRIEAFERANGKGDVPFVSERLTTVDQIIAAGWRDNIGHGQLPTKAERNRAVRRLKEAGKSLQEIADMVNLDKSSVSRILRDLQASVAEGKKKRKKATKKKGAAAPTNGAAPFTPEGWTKAFASLGTQYRKHHEALVKYMENAELVAALDAIFMPPQKEQATEATTANSPDAA